MQGVHRRTTNKSRLVWMTYEVMMNYLVPYKKEENEKLAAMGRNEGWENSDGMLRNIAWQWDQAMKFCKGSAIRPFALNC